MVITADLPKATQKIFDTLGFFANEIDEDLVEEELA